MKKIDWNEMFKYTGDPFIDAGGFVLQELMECYPDADIMTLIMMVTDIYVKLWDAKINTLFLNSKITQPAFKGERKKEEARRYFESLLDETLSYRIGCCRIMGNNTKLFPVGRDLSVLTGSGTFVNFHHAFQEGIMLSKEAIIRYYFLPLGCELLQGKIAVICSNNPKISEWYARDCCSRVLAEVGQNVSTGVLKSSAHSLGTAVFRYLDSVLARYTEDNGMSDSVALYHLTNFGASPEVQIYTLPFQAFRFYQRTQSSRFRERWNIFVASHYFNSDYKKAKYDDEKNVFCVENKKDNIYIDEEKFKYWRNAIYDKLLKGASILGDIRKWSVHHFFDVDLLNLYLVNLQNMKKETIAKLDKISNYILESTSESGMKKVIITLSGTKSAYVLRRFIIGTIRKYYNEGHDQPLVTVEEYVDYLFPDSSSWMEIRDVLLISIYQKLHERNLHIEVDMDDFDDEQIEYES